MLEKLKHIKNVITLSLCFLPRSCHRMTVFIWFFTVHITMFASVCSLFGVLRLKFTSTKNAVSYIFVIDKKIYSFINQSSDYKVVLIPNQEKPYAEDLW
ncbi:hypothetical protein A8L45_02975 [Veronia pacifica]|uniref:Uncharacterized protein n=1 Tax=Veronia pacifica TaxID=1080227 RepID=A0A1C3EQS9_9GAMM|nr:hypothetical protein A8L45_02975 [Veronia pacifica]